MSDSAATPPAPPPLPAVFRRRRPIGAEPSSADTAHVRLWAPRAAQVEVVARGGERLALSPEDGGYFSGTIAAAVGDRYQFKLDDDEKLYPDPASRFQPEGPHGASAIVDPRRFRWTDSDWKGTSREGQVIYELHVGTFTREGTWAAAAHELPALARIGISIVEVMPIAEFDGRFGWGYDGVDLYAPSHLYGEPDDFRRFVDVAHAVGVGVILDVVYNHLGPAGNYLRTFAPEFFTNRYQNEWGESINYDGPDSGPVREFFVENAAYWIDEYHLDGLRLDATQSIFDRSDEHILTVIGRRAREAAGERQIVIVAENEPQQTRLVRSTDDGGYGLDALWNDDFHHSAMVALTGRAEAYYSDTRGEPQELISAVKYGYLFQGQHYSWQRDHRGSASWGLAPSAFVAFTQNHDQVANSARGERGHELTSPGKWRAVTALLLLQPSTPMLFQGQEFSSSSPFLYFADFEPVLAAAIHDGRGEFLSQFPSLAETHRSGGLPNPGALATFERCKLDLRERESHHASYALHIDLLRLRRSDPAFSKARPNGLDGAVLSPAAFGLRFFTPDHREDRLLIVNLGREIQRSSFAEPLLAPPAATDWRLEWSSDDARYGGPGTADMFPDDWWHVPAEAAVVLTPGPRRPRRPLPAIGQRRGETHG
ncbi:MAG: malto-oligosyltrehalose trehalohydrolase [Vicinamibacterales bacterium]